MQSLNSTPKKQVSAVTPVATPVTTPSFKVTEQISATPVRKKKIKLVKKPSESPAQNNKAEKVKKITEIVSENYQNRDRVEKEELEISRKRDRLKQELAIWMKEIGKEKILWNDRSINPISCVKIGRTEASDILEAVGHLYGEDSMIKVSEELNKLHVIKHEGKFDVKFEKDKRVAVKTRSTTGTKKEPRPSKPLPLIL
jgi:hypothetical protein